MTPARSDPAAGSSTIPLRSITGSVLILGLAEPKPRATNGELAENKPEVDGEGFPYSSSAALLEGEGIFPCRSCTLHAPCMHLAMVQSHPGMTIPQVSTFCVEILWVRLGAVGQRMLVREAFGTTHVEMGPFSVDETISEESDSTK